MLPDRSGLVFAVTVAASVLLHGAALAVVAMATWTRGPLLAEPEQEIAFLELTPEEAEAELTLEEPEPEEPEPEEPEPEELSEEPEPPEPRVAARVPIEEPPPLREEPTEPREPSMEQPSTEQPETPPRTTTEATERVAREEALRDILISGRESGETFSLGAEQVALGTLRLEDVDPDDRERRPERRSLAERRGEIEAELSAGLAGEANARAHVSRRPPPELNRRPDGSYSFSGPRFSAVIAADGEVQFNDRPGVNIEGPGTEGGPGLSGTFDLSDAMQGARGQDPLRAERTWFMRGTRELRERLMAQRDRTTQTRALSELRGELRRIWGSSRSGARKRAEIFQIWDETSDDEVGGRARQIVIEFILQNAPEGSELAYSEAELRSLNAQRASRIRFAPYRP